MVNESRELAEDYEIAEVLGRGGFSIVRLGKKRDYSMRGKDRVAIKTLKRIGPSSSSGRPTWKEASISDALLTNEIMVMKRIVDDVAPHPNVIDLYDVYEDSSGVHLVLELCSGGELFDRIVSQKQYSEVEAAGVVRQIADGLSAIHKANIVHRDLKPENCLFLDTSEKSTLKIMDFGLSSVEDFTDPVVGMFGSIDYVSPETLSRASKVTSATDLWSLGVILYILLSGYPPFMAQSNKQKQQMIMNGEYSFHEKTWKRISSAAKQVISGLLTVDPQKRMTAIELLQHPWVTGDLAKPELMDPEVVSRLQSFNARRKFRAAAIASMYTSTIFMKTKKLKSLLGSHDLTPEEIEKFRTHFHRICQGDNATLDEFEQVLKAMNMLSLIPLSRRIFDLFDYNRDGTVDMREILCGFTTLRKSQGDDALRLCFQMYDTDRSGCISKEEVASMLRALPDDCLPADITEPGKLDEVFDKMDANNDGKVTFDEFKAAMTRDSSLKDVLLSSLRPL